MKRRDFVGGMMAVAVGVVLAPMRALAARPEEAFKAEKMDGVLQAMFGSTELTDSGDITIKAPDIAENGAVVPVTVNFNVKGAETVSIIAEENPAPLAASFSLTEASGNTVSTRIKMGKTSKVHAVVKAGGKLYRASKEVKVTIGGCGG